MRLNELDRQPGPQRLRPARVLGAELLDWRLIQQQRGEAGAHLKLLGDLEDNSSKLGSHDAAFLSQILYVLLI